MKKKYIIALIAGYIGPKILRIIGIYPITIFKKNVLNILSELVIFLLIVLAVYAVYKIIKRQK